MFYIEYQYDIWSSRCDYGGSQWWIQVEKRFRTRESMEKYLIPLQNSFKHIIYREKDDIETLRTVEETEKDISRMKEKIVAYCDGSCNNKTGEGGLGVYIKYKEHEHIVSQGYSNTTSNRMELRAFITVLKEIHNKEIELHIFSDSKYTVNTFKSWIFRWEKEGWDGRKNVDLLKEGVKELKKFKFGTLHIHWCKGHSGIEGNEIADMLAEEGRLQDNKLKCRE